MSGAEIAAEVAAALAEAGEATGTGAYICTIRRASAELDEPQNPWDEPADPVNAPQLFPVTAMKSVREVKDMTGTLIGVAYRKVKIVATGVLPLKSDVIALGVAPGDVTADTVFEEIIKIHTEEPTNVPLYHDLYLAI